MSEDVARPVFDLLCASAVGVPEEDRYFQELLQCIEKKQEWWPFPQGSRVKGKLVFNNGAWRIIVDFTELRLGATWASVQTILNRKIEELQTTTPPE